VILGQKYRLNMAQFWRVLDLSLHEV
jgi:hypothetical protein